MADTDTLMAKFSPLKVQETEDLDVKDVDEIKVTNSTDIDKSSGCEESETISDQKQEDSIMAEETKPDSLTAEVSKKSKSKWKLKICVGKSTLINSEDKELKIEDDEQKNNNNSGDEMIDVGTTDIPQTILTTPLPGKRKIKRKSFGIEGTSSQAKKPKGGLRSDCPPFCKTNCSYDHHPLLVSARKMIENDSNSTMTFLDIVASYYGGDMGSMTFSDSIHDPWKNTSFPLLHYIALMGKCAGCFAMTDAGHASESTLSENGDTVLHTMIREMYTFNCTHGHMDILLKKFNLLLKEFSNCLLISNKELQTPFHVCCTLISEVSVLLCDSSKNKPPFRLYQFLKNMLLSMLEQFRSTDLDVSSLNMTDHAQNTFSHYLAQDRASFDILDEIKEMGADFQAINNKNESVELTMENATPGPPEEVIQMAIFSAMGRKYKSLHQKPCSQVVREKPSKPSPSPSRSVNLGKPKRTIKPTFKALSSIESKLVDEKPKLVESEINDNVEKTYNSSPAESPLTLQVKGRPRMKITPTRKEKQDKKLAKKMAIKENVLTDEITSLSQSSLTEKMAMINAKHLAVTTAPPLSTNTTVLSVVSSAALAGSANVLTILTGKQPNTNIAKVKPIIIAPSHSPSMSSVVIDGKTSKLEISPFSIVNGLNLGNVNKQSSIPLQVSNQGPNNPILISASRSSQPGINKPIIVKTKDGSLLELQEFPRQQQMAKFPNNLNKSNIRMVEIPSNARFTGNLQQAQLRPVNMNGQWIYPPPNFQMQYAQSIQSPPRQMAISSNVFFGPNQVIQTSATQHQQQHQSPSMIIGTSRPTMMTQNVSPMNVIQQQQQPSMAYSMRQRQPNNLSMKPLQVPTFPPFPFKPAARPQIQPQLPVAMQNHAQQLLGIAPTYRQQQQQQIPSNLLAPKILTETPLKRGRNLEASIRNLQSISMDIISSNGNTTKTTGESPTPNQAHPPPSQPPAEESAPPVYIIDTDDEQHIFTEEMMNNKERAGSGTPSNDKEETNNAEEHISKFVLNAQFHFMFIKQSRRFIHSWFPFVVRLTLGIEILCKIT